MGRGAYQRRRIGRPLTTFTMSVFKSKPGKYTSKSSSYKERGNAEDWSSRTHSAMQDHGGLRDSVCGDMSVGEGGRGEGGEEGEEMAWRRESLDRGGS